MPTDTAPSASPDGAGHNGVYFVSDEANNLSLSQMVYLTSGSYDIGFDSYDTDNGYVQPNDAILTATIAGVPLATIDIATVPPGAWTTHAGEALIQTAGNYLVSFAFTTPNTPANPGSNADGRYDAKDVVIDQAYVIGAADTGGTPIPPATTAAVPEPASLALLGAGLLAFSLARRRRPE